MRRAPNSPFTDGPEPCPARDPEKEKQALRVMKEFAWEHNMPLVGKVIERLRARISRQS